MRKALVTPLAVLALGLVSCSNAFNAAAAVVNGTRIPMDQVEDEADAQLATPQQGGLAAQDPNARLTVARNVLEGLIGRLVVRQEGARLGIHITQKQIDAEVAQFRRQFTDLDQRVKEQGWTPQEFRERVHDQALYDALTQKLAPVTDARVRTEYNNTRANLREVRYSDILISSDKHSQKQALKLIREAKARIQSGESFASVAKDVSEDQATTDAGGHGGFLLIQALDVQDAGIGDALARAPLHKVSGPVRSATGYHLLLVAARRIQPFSEASKDIKDRLQQTLGQEAINKVLADGLKAAKVVVNPRYGDWDLEQAHIVEHKFFEPPTVNPNEPPTGAIFTPAPVAPPGT